MKTKTFILVSLLCLSTIASTPIAGAATLELLKPEPADLATSTLTQADVPEGVAAPTNKPVRMVWALDPQTVLAERPVPPFAESRSYWFTASAAELEAGVGIDTTAAEAVVRINPLGQGGIALDPQTFEIIDPTERTLTADESMQYLVSSEQLAASDNPFPEGTAAFRFRTELGSGRFVLRAPLPKIDGSSRFVVHVFEPESAVVANLALASGAILEGRPIEATATLSSTGLNSRLKTAEAFLIAPDGRRTALRLNGNLVASAVVDRAVAGGGLWEIEFRLSGGTKHGFARRTVRSAFSVAAATARPDGRVEIVEAGNLTVRLGVASAATGRYEIRGVLWGTNADGAMVPIAVAHSAASFGVGRRELELVFDEKLLSASGTSAPYELRDLQLTDQTRMGVLHRQARALVIE